MMLEAKIKAIRRKIAVTGILGALKIIIDHVVTRVFHREDLLFYVDVSNYSMKPENLCKYAVGKQIKCIDDLKYRDIESIKDYAGENYIEEIKRRLIKNWNFFLAYIEDNIVGGGWVIDHNSEFKTKVVPLFDNDIVLIDFFTFPSFRGRNIYPFILSFIVTYFREKNIIRAFISANEKDFSSIKGIQKAGFRHFINYEVYNFRHNEIVVWKGTSIKKQL